MLQTSRPTGVFLCVYVDEMPAQICRGTPVHTPADQHSPEGLQNKTYSKDYLMNMRGLRLVLSKSVQMCCTVRYMSNAFSGAIRSQLFLFGN